MGRGTYVIPSRKTLGVFLVDDWLPVVGRRLRPTTLSGYEEKIRNHIRPGLGSIALQDLTPTQINAFYSHLLERGRKRGAGGLSRRTVQYIHAILRRALQDALRWNLIAKNPADLADPPRISSGDRALKIQTWSVDEVTAFLHGVRPDRLSALWLLAVTTGMRRGELLGLTWSKVDLEKKRLSVTQTLVASSGRAEFSPPKTAKSRRVVALDQASIGALVEHEDRQLLERSAAGDAYQDHDLVFVDGVGRPLDPNWVSKRFKNLAVEVGLHPIRFHDLRHTFATMALRAGIHPKVVSDRLGHATVAITLDTYSHAVPELETEAASRVAELILPSRNNA